MKAILKAPEEWRISRTTRVREPRTSVPAAAARRTPAAGNQREQRADIHRPIQDGNERLTVPSIHSARNAEIYIFLAQ